MCVAKWGKNTILMSRRLQKRLKPLLCGNNLPEMCKKSEAQQILAYGTGKITVQIIERS